VDLDALAEFFANPARYFLLRRMDVRLPRPMSELTEREPMDMAGLDRFLLKSELLEKRLAGADLISLQPAYRASGLLPYGRMGELLYRDLCESIEELRERLARFRPHERLTPPELDLELDGFRLLGRFDHVTSLALLHYRPSVVTPKDRIRVWVRHLAWCASPAAHPRLSAVVGEPSRFSTSVGFCYRDVGATDARDFLRKLLGYYWRGLSEPLHFFPSTSLKFAEIDRKNADRRPDAWKDSLLQSRKAWESDGYKRGEDDDEHYKICFHHFDPLDGDFMALARNIGQPLLAYQEAL
jgi:exodeoxyribonuclease V gamma subunit